MGVCSCTVWPLYFGVWCLVSTSRGIVLARAELAGESGLAMTCPGSGAVGVSVGVREEREKSRSSLLSPVGTSVCGSAQGEGVCC